MDCRRMEVRNARRAFSWVWRVAFWSFEVEIIVVAVEDDSESENGAVMNCTSYSANSASYAIGNISIDSSSGVMDGR